MTDLTTASIAVTGRCNLQCSFCGDPAIGTGGRGAPLDPSRRSLHAVFRQLARCGTGTVIISGGEPFLRDDLPALVDDAGSCGHSCVILTNGTLLHSRILRKMHATGAVSHIRLSLEVPSGHEYGRFHDARQAVRCLEMIADAGIVAGVNMTLFPHTLSYIPELIERCRTAGAAFFRAVPVLPVGWSSGGIVPVAFFTECMTKLLLLHEIYANVADTVSYSPTARRLITESFACSCPGGSRSIAISADGNVHICPMIIMEGKNISCFNQPLATCVAAICRRKQYLQRMITGSERSACRGCKKIDQCRGGCIAEWYARGRPHGQPYCYKKMMNNILHHSPQKAEIVRAAIMLADKIDFTRVVRGEAICLRSLPLWTIRFSGSYH